MQKRILNLFYLLSSFFFFFCFFSSNLQKADKSPSARHAHSKSHSGPSIDTTCPSLSAIPPRAKIMIEIVLHMETPVTSGQLPPSTGCSRSTSAPALFLSLYSYLSHSKNPQNCISATSFSRIRASSFPFPA